MNALRIARLAALTLSVAAASLACGGSNLEAPTAVSAATGEALGLDSSSWQLAFPSEYASWTSVGEGRPSPTGWGGSIPYQRLDRFPYLKALFAGNPFSKDYKEDRAHVHAWRDLVESGRLSGKTPASCLTCKTPYVAELFAAEGWAYASKPLSAYLGEKHPTVSCASCHDPLTKRLRVTQPAFIEATYARGVDLAKASHRDMMTFTCAQCHSEYFFEPVTNRVVHPWGSGLDPESMLAYYASAPLGFESDWKHAISGADMLKAQHPDFEEYSSGVHAAAGVTCADCHMPRTGKGSATSASHAIGSPLATVESSCLSCHNGKSVDWMITRVRYIQDELMSVQDSVGLALASAHEAIGRAASLPTADAALIGEARLLIRQAQWLWDYVASSNSGGFHSPVQGLATLAKAGLLAARAEAVALIAAR
jgi:nitrite reductase (cytochrome c-552)